MTCIICDGELYLLGQLGGRIHLRCRNCGIDQSFPVNTGRIAHDAH